MEYLSDYLQEPQDFYAVLAWDELSTKSQNTLQRAIERSDIWRTSDTNGFSFDLLSKISIEDLHDARFIGPARAEELIQELISLFQNRASQNFVIQKENSLAEPFEKCANFSDIYQVLESELLKLPKVDARAIAMLKHRHWAFAEPGLTLDEIGRKWGLTRERVRQIVNPLMSARIQPEPEVSVLVRAIEIYEKCQDEYEFQRIVSEDSLFAGEKINWERLWGIAMFLSPDKLAIRVHQKHEKFLSEMAANSPIRGLIKKHRSKFGLYELKVVSNKFAISEDKAFKIIADVYPRSIRCGSLVLARTRNLDTMFENSIAKQLKVSNTLSVEELCIGLERSGNYRGVAVIGSKSDLSDLIEKIAGKPPRIDNLPARLVREVDFRTLESWLIEIFENSNLGILHANEVVNMALREKGINVSSVSVYLITSPIVRSHGKSIYSLVGTEVSQDVIEDYSRIIRETAKASEVSYEMTEASKGTLCVKPNMNVITNGIVFPPSGYKEIFEGFEFETSCRCGNLNTRQAVKFAPSGFWTGFTAMIRHGFSEHQMSKDSTFRFLFDFDKSNVVLLWE